MLTDDEAAELAALRARAYGPDADLRDDPVAIARLERLETAARATSAPVEADEADASAQRDAAGAPHDTPAPRDTRAPHDTRAPASVPPVPAPGAPASDPAAPRAAAAEPGPRAPRRNWPLRRVLAVGIPALLVALVAGWALGSATSASVAPQVSTTLAPKYVESMRFVGALHDWDDGSPRLLADIEGIFVWGGTTASGTMSCVVADDQQDRPGACAPTDQLTADGLGVVDVDPTTGVSRTFVVWPGGAPLVTYSTDANGSFVDAPCAECEPQP